MKKTRVNILTAINAASVTINRTEIDGEKYAIIKNVLWMTDGVVLNGGLYAAEDNEKGYPSMDGRLMPFRHPEVNGEYVAISQLDSADVAVALGKHYGGVHAQNVRKAGSDYFVDVMINERVANAHDDGVLLLNWVGKVESGEKPDPIHMSTGLMTNRVQANGESRGKKYTWRAANQAYDHLAILFHENGAGGDEIAIAVNCEMVINSKLDEANDDVLDESYRDKLEILSSAVRERFATQDSYAYVEDFDDRALVYCTPEGTYTIDYHFEGENPILTGESKPVVVETSYKVKTNSVMARLKAVVEYFSTKTNQPVVQVNTPEEKDMTPEEVQAIVDKAVGAAVDAVNLKLNSSEAQVKSLQEALQANSDSLLKDKRAAVAKVHGEVVANALSGEALDAMYVGVQTAAGILSGSVATNAKDEFEGYSLNQADQEAK
ncbi:hypothetical protein D3C71_276770 [compost metagenome]